MDTLFIKSNPTFRRQCRNERRLISKGEQSGLGAWGRLKANRQRDSGLEWAVSTNPIVFSGPSTTLVSLDASVSLGEFGRSHWPGVGRDQSWARYFQHSPGSLSTCSLIMPLCSTPPAFCGSCELLVCLDGEAACRELFSHMASVNSACDWT